MNAYQLRTLIVRPALEAVGLHSPAAENLVMGTAAQESRLNYVHQLGSGPAKGLWQVEPATYADYLRYLSTRPTLRRLILKQVGYLTLPPVERVVSDLSLAAIMCRIHYRRVSAPLPDANDVDGMARYWKKYYNTHLGAGTVEQFVRNYALVKSD